jgi:hypothetical protein
LNQALRNRTDQKAVEEIMTCFQSLRDHETGNRRLGKVRSRGFKIRRREACRFESDLGHHSCNCVVFASARFARRCDVKGRLLGRHARNGSWLWQGGRRQCCRFGKTLSFLSLHQSKSALSRWIGQDLHDHGWFTAISRDLAAIRAGRARKQCAGRALNFGPAPDKMRAFPP